MTTQQNKIKIKLFKRLRNPVLFMTILQRYLYLSLDTIKSPQSWREKDGRALARRDTASPQPDKTHTLSSKTQARKLGTSFIMKYNTFQVIQ